MAQATSSSERALLEVVDAVVAVLGGNDTLSGQTLARLEVLMRRFAGFAGRGHGVASLDQVSARVAQAYVDAPTSEGVAPGPSVQHFRRFAVRVLFRTGRRLGMTAQDPSLDLVLPPRTRGAFRPLEDDEVDLARAATLGAARRARAAAGWALCEATARTGELAAIRRRDVDLAGGRVWIHGSPRTTPRWGALTDWGVTQLARHVAALADPPDTPVIGGGPPGTALAQSSAVGLISQTLTRAGLGEAPDVRPSSVAAWAGRKIFDATGRIDVTAQRLGMRSLDRAAVFIGWDWTAPGG